MSLVALFMSTGDIVLKTERGREGGGKKEGRVGVGCVGGGEKEAVHDGEQRGKERTEIGGG